jgi:preprotein translocase subunit SecA
MNIHRNVIYKRRQKFLKSEDHKEEIENMIKESAENIVRNYTEARPVKEWNYQEIHEALTAIHKDENFKIENLQNIKKQEELIETSEKYLLDYYNKKEGQLPEPKILRAVERAVYLRANDVLWMEHIDSMTRLRENVAFSGYAQKDPLTEYKSQGYNMFNEMLGMIRNNAVNTLFKIDPEKIIPQEMLARAAVKNMNTNAAQVSEPLSGHDERKNYNNFAQATSDNPVIIKADSGVIGPRSQTQNLPKVGRNEPCPCGSGKKFKKCCG